MLCKLKKRLANYDTTMANMKFNNTIYLFRNTRFHFVFTKQVKSKRDALELFCFWGYECIIFHYDFILISLILSSDLQN